MTEADVPTSPGRSPKEFLRDASLILLAGLLLGAPRLWAKSLWSPDEARYAEVAREMSVTGNYLIPRVYGEPETSYPPLYYWLIALSSLPPGRVSALSATLPSLLAALGVGLLTYGIGRTLWDRRSAFLSALVLMPMAGFVGPAILCRGDMTMVLLEVAALLFFTRWYRDRDSGAFPLAFYVALAGAVLVKGPQAVLIVGGIVLVFLGVRGELGLVRRLRLLPGLAVFLVLTLPWFVWAWRTTRQDFLLGESLSGFAGTLVPGGHSRRSWWTYLGVIAVRAFPWILFLPSALALIWRDERAGSIPRRPDGALAFLGSWIAVVLVFYTLAAAKRYYYVTAVYPAVALAVGRFWARGAGPGTVPASFLRLPLVALALLALGSELYLDLGPSRIGSFDLTSPRWGYHCLPVAALIAAAAGLALPVGGHKLPMVATILGALAAAAHLGSMALYEIPQNRRDEEDGRRFVETLEGAMRPGDPVYLFQEDVPSVALHLGRECRILRTPGELRARTASGERVIVGVKEWRLPDAQAILGPARIVFREPIPGGGAVLIFLRPEP